ncbi:peptidoglycan DD-metalloendopeptidase family protein [Vagococcus sp. DIV0080]|uniref:Peptidoglycan DD-metalloendopeptidase family protein n=1 Tax=Candidatus Vagococcus giribetii TaxID=2230876 RepID=A0ABS3HRG1_9ENTE|nr:peptidoglycan DD-metalloendopeptidase family protein [Vagococcus sp. DIV0080]MBO0476354.1 peptidoglycan DD-metalloendopeptidase family protein [Vagococcus sp. DIV0080]
MKIKKSIVLTVATLSIMGLTCPGVVQAESIDSKIANEEQKINDLSAKKAASDSSLADLEAKINSLTSETDSLLKEKATLEKEVNQLTEEIKELEIKIEKRNQKIEEQARSTQINQDKQDLVNVLLDSESISDAIGRTVAYSKLVSANNDIMEAQKEDQDNLNTKKASVEEKVQEVTEKAAVLKEKQAELETSKIAQVKLANDILKNLDDAKNKKSEFVAQKAEAERIAAEQAKKAKEIAEQQKAAQQAAADAQKAFEKEQEKANDQLEANGPSSITKPTGDKGASDNSESSYASGFQRPLSSFTITSTFGPRQDPTGFAGDFHDGLDMAAPAGTPIMASRAGTVVESSYHYSAGNHVIIQHDNGYYTYYMHMSQPGIAAGSTVSAGDVVGLVGTTGSSTGNHLHFGISTGLWSGFMNPAPFIGL